MERECKECRKTFEAKITQYYCSAYCRMRHNKKKQKRTLSPTANCQHCGTEFTRSTERSSKQLYCSRKCCNAHHYQNAIKLTAETPSLPPIPKNCTPATLKLLQLFYGYYPNPTPYTAIKKHQSIVALSRLIVDGIVAVSSSSRDQSNPCYKLVAPERLAQWDNA